MMRLFCRFGRHSPSRRKALVDLQDMTERSCCKGCGVPMKRELGGYWRLQEAARHALPEAALKARSA